MRNVLPVNLRGKSLAEMFDELENIEDKTEMSAVIELETEGEPAEPVETQVHIEI